MSQSRSRSLKKSKIKKSGWQAFKKKSSGDAVKVKSVVFPEDYDPKVDGITQSMLMAFMKCRREFVLKLNRWSLTEKRTVFANGTITHEVLDRVYTFYKNEGKLPSKAKIKKWCDNFDKEEDHKDWLPEDKQELAELYKLVAYVICTEYVRHYRKIDFVPGRITGAEIEFDVEWKGYRLRGKRDLRFQLRPGEDWIMETKTMARIEPDAIRDKLTFDFQNLYYVTAEEIENNTTVHGVLYNVVRNPGQKTKAGESIQQYANRLRREIRKNPSHYFLRFPQPYTEQDKKQFRKELIHKLHEVSMLKEGKLYPWKNEKNCIARFKCPFLKACSCGKLIGYGQYKRLFSELEEQ